MPQANHQLLGCKAKKLKRSSSKNKSSTCTTKILGQIKSMVILTIHLGRTIPTSDGETTIIKTNNHGKETQARTIGKTQTITPSQTLTKIHTENHKIITPTLSIIHPITTQQIKTPIIIHQQPKTNQFHKNRKGSLI